jgi:hypothetical protein
VVAAKKDDHVTAAGVAERCELVQGDFFEKDPAGADAYIMKYILHDWEEERALAILRNCRKAMSEGGRVSRSTAWWRPAMRRTRGRRWTST